MLLAYVLFISMLVVLSALTIDVVKGIEGIEDLKPAPQQPKPETAWTHDTGYYTEFDAAYDAMLVKMSSTPAWLVERENVRPQKSTGSHRRGRLDNFTRKVYGL